MGKRIGSVDLRAPSAIFISEEVAQLQWAGYCSLLSLLLLLLGTSSPAVVVLAAASQRAENVALKRWMASSCATE